MADLNDFRDRIAAVEAQILKELPSLATTMALTAKALSERRIREVGFGEKYSDHKIPVWFLKGKELNSAGLDYIENAQPKKGDKKKKTLEEITDQDLADGMGNWAEFRAAQGLQSGHVDFGYTNKTWAAMAPIKVTEENLVFTAYLGATNEEAQKKMNYGYKMYGDFVSRGLVDTDRKIMAGIPMDGIKKIIDNSNLIK